MTMMTIDDHFADE